MDIKRTKRRLSLGITIFHITLLPYLERCEGYMRFDFLIFHLEYRNREYDF